MVPMRYAIDGHAIGQHLTGNEVYVRSLLSALASIDKESDFLAYIAVKDAEAWLPERIRLRYVSQNPFVRLGFDLPKRLREDRPDVFHVQYTAPLRCPSPTVVSVHDVSFLEHPEYFTRIRRSQLRLTVAASVRHAARVITGSNFSRDSILRAYPIDPAKVIVVPDAANPSFRVVNREAAARKILDSFHISTPYIFSVGDLQPRKNQIGLIEAFAKLVRAYPQLPHKLVLTGKETWFAPKVHLAAKQSGVSDRIIFTNFVSDGDLLQLYNACDCFVFPSLYEGFGIPILEAMACGRAVACSNTSAMPEVADGAGLLFDPYRVDEIARAMADILLDPGLRARLERMGPQRAAGFTWQKTARMTLDIYEEVAGHAQRMATDGVPAISTAK